MIVVLYLMYVYFLGEPMDSVHEEGVRPPPQDLLKIDHTDEEEITTSPDTDSKSTSPSTPREDAAPTPPEKTSHVTPKPGLCENRIS